MDITAIHHFGDHHTLFYEGNGALVVAEALSDFRFGGDLRIGVNLPQIKASKHIRSNQAQGYARAVQEISPQCRKAV